jgi:ArsR family transcriptional regulator, arsenate/arsenite/antimonite-responsive transcriptional repressor
MALSLVAPQHIRWRKYILDHHICQCEYECMATKRAFDLEHFFQSLGDQTRLRLLNLMGDQEICVCYFVEILGQPQPKISRHLAYLRGAGIVAARREGKWMHYRIVMPPHVGAAQVLRQTLAFLQEEKVMQADRAKLTKACCSPKKSAALEGAPLPATIECSSCEAI